VIPKSNPPLVWSQPRPAISEASGDRGLPGRSAKTTMLRRVLLVVSAAGKSLRVAAIGNPTLMALLAAATNLSAANGSVRSLRFTPRLERPVARLAQRMGPLAHVIAYALPSPDSATQWPPIPPVRPHSPGLSSPPCAAPPPAHDRPSALSARLVSPRDPRRLRHRLRRPLAANLSAVAANAAEVLPPLLALGGSLHAASAGVRVTVPMPTSRRFEMSRMLRPCARNWCTSARLKTRLSLPRTLPAFLAALMPACTRSRIKLRSNSAAAPKTCSRKRPAGSLWLVLRQSDATRHPRAGGSSQAGRSWRRSSDLRKSRSESSRGPGCIAPTLAAGRNSAPRC